ncbi:MAG: TonB-dependent receptor [Pseudomonadota bacterium]
MNTRWYSLSLAGLLLFSNLTWAQAPLNLPSQTLDKALLAVGQHFDISVVASETLTTGVLAPSIDGARSAEDAIERLLKGSGLAVVRSERGGYIVVKARNDANSARILPLEEMIVKGQKRELRLRDLNSSVAVYTDNRISDTTFVDLTDLYQFTPNVQATVTDEGDFAIRGVAFRGIDGSATSLAGAMYVDGIIQSVLGVEAGPSSVFDLEQVEIYRGAQSTVQGRNALAGAIVVNTADPGYEWTVKGRAEYADYNTQRYGLAFGGPIIDEQLAFRVAIDDYETDGFIENPAAGIDDINFDDTVNRRAKLLLEPKAVEGFSALLTYIDTEGFAGTGFGTGTVNGPDFFDRNVRPEIASPTLLEIETENWALELGQRFSDQFRLEFIATSSDAREESGPRFGEFDLDVFFDLSLDEEQVETYDLRGIWESDRLSLVSGLYYFEHERETAREFGLVFQGIFSTSGGHSQVENAAIYLDGEFRIRPDVALLFGARYDNEEFEEAGFNALTFGAPANPESLEVNFSDTEYDAFLPKLGLRWDQTDSLSWSFVYQRGYRAGRAAIDNTNTAYDFDPEYTDNFEIALRSVLLDGKLNLNANLFYTDWTDQHVITLIPGTSALAFRTDNAGESELYGFELDATFSLTSDLTLVAGTGWLQTEFKDYVNQQTGEDFSGNSFPQSPELTLSVGLFYEHSSGIYGSIDARYQDDCFSDPDNFEEHMLDSYVLANAKLGYRRGNWSVALFARNLFDEDYLVRVRGVVDNPEGPLSWEAAVGAPRVVGGELNFSF